jgi:hypothetical protein
MAQPVPGVDPDGSRVALNLNLNGKHGIYERAANGVGEPVLLLEGTVFAQAVSPDGRFLLYMYRGVKRERTFGCCRGLVTANRSRS